MKRILFAAILLIFVSPAFKQANGDVGVSLNFFYDNIESDGSWVEVGDYGYCWQPSVAVSNVRWRPYWDGYWAYTDAGWAWISYEDFGWATYHYGRWVRLRDRGWFWVPGREWAPAWVSWRTGGDYVGWAPLPPRTVDEYVDDSSPITGHVDVEFDIGPMYYNFVDVRYIGEPVLRERIFEPTQNVTYITNTVNVTNITYTNSMVHTYGPDYNTLNQYATRPIRRMTIERNTTIDPNAAAKSKSVTKVEGDKLVVAAPMTLEKPAASVAPKAFKEKIAKPTVEKGWSDLPDAKAQSELKQKMKNEDPKAVPPPSIKPRENAPAGQAPPTSASVPPGAITSPANVTKPGLGSPRPAATVAPGAIASPGIAPGKDKGKRLNETAPVPTAAGQVNPATSPANPPPGKGKKDRFARPTPPLGAPTASGQGVTPPPAPKKPNDRRQEPPSSLATSPDGAPSREAPAPDETRKGKRGEKPTNAMPPPQQPESMPDKAQRKQHHEMPPPPTRPAPPENMPMPKQPLPPQRMAPPSQQAPPSQRQPPEAPRKRQQPPERQAPPPGPGPGANAAEQQAPHGKHGQEKKGDQPAPSPGQ